MDYEAGPKSDELSPRKLREGTGNVQMQELMDVWLTACCVSVPGGQFQHVPSLPTKVLAGHGIMAVVAGRKTTKDEERQRWGG